MKKLLDMTDRLGKLVAKLIVVCIVVWIVGAIFFGILRLFLSWHGWVSEGTVDTSRCTTIVQLSPTTFERYYKSFTCDEYSDECVHVDWNGSSCEAFTSNW
jgi:hypothetical protein